MKHYFLLDFENVSDAGLAGFFELTPEDTVYLFYTQKSNRISIDYVTALMECPSHAEMRFIKVASGNQALDLQLASFLGSLIAERREESDYWIISKDKGFACLGSFWTNQSGLARLAQAGSIQEALASLKGKSAPRQQSTPAPAPIAAAEAEAPVSVPEVSAATSELPEPVQQPEAPEETAQEPEKLPAEPAAQEAPPAPAEQSQPKPKDKPKSAPAQPQNEKSILNSKVQQTLSKAKYDNKITAHAASLISKSFGDKKIKQIVYRDFIKQYGQKKGLELYNLVKPLLK